MLDAPEYARWRHAATDAAAGARAQRDHGLFQWGCFLAEQSAQLAVKALLHGVGAGAWGHDLADLLRRLQEVLDVDVPEPVLDAALRLSRHYIAARYPDAHPAGTPGGHYSGSDADTALRDAEALHRFVDDQWGALGAADSTSDHAG